MNIIKIIWVIIQFIIGYNLVLPLLIYVFWKLINRKKALGQQQGYQADYAIIVTAYQYTEMLPSVVASLLKLNYANYIVYVVADNCDIESLNFNDQRVILLKPVEILASNTRSHLYAIDHFVRTHDRLTIIDSDNLVDPEYLNELNKYFDQGHVAVQGIRAAKNLDNTLSSLDAARDIYYHFYDGKLLYEVGSSATLAGSGMAFTVNLYRDFLSENDVKGAGFDKLLQFFLLSKDLKIAFAGEAIVFDEKTSRSDQLVNQRARWINTWFRYFKLGFTLLGKGIRNMSLNQILFGLILLRPPLFIFILLSGFFMVLNLFMNQTAFFIWLLCFGSFFISFFVALGHGKTDARIYRSLTEIPRFIWFQVISLIKSRNANKRSVSTVHFHKQTFEDLNDKKR